MSTAERYRMLRSGYYRRVEIGVITAVAIHAVFFTLAPPYVPRPFHLPPERPLRLVEESGSARTESAREASPPPTLVPRGAPMLAALESEQIEPVPATGAKAAGPATAGGGEGTGTGVGATGAYEEPPVFYSYETAPQAVRRVEPEYPLAARVAGAEGTVVINVNIGSDGRILRAWVAHTTAPESLVETALDAVYQFEFLPGKQGGHPVKCTVAIPFHFSLKRTF